MPWLGLFHKIALASDYVSFDMVQYAKKEYLNRNYIKGTDGSRLRLTVPVMTSGKFDQLIETTEIDNRNVWARKHWRSLQLCYGDAPYFDRYAPFFEDLYRREWRLLVDLNRTILKFLLEAFGIEVSLSRAADNDFRGSGSELVLDMCRQLRANAFIFGEAGVDYADTEAFETAGIHVFFQTYEHPIYPQLHGEFVGGLSAIDLLFNCGSDSFEILMTGNTTPAEFHQMLRLQNV